MPILQRRKVKKRIPLTGSQSGEVAQVEFDPEQTGPWVVGGGPERTRAGAVGQAWGGGGKGSWGGVGVRCWARFHTASGHAAPGRRAPSRRGSARARLDGAARGPVREQRTQPGAGEGLRAGARGPQRSSWGGGCY